MAPRRHIHRVGKNRPTLQDRLAVTICALEACQRANTALHQIAALAFREQSLEAILQMVVQEIRVATGVPIVAIERYDESRQEMELVAAIGIALPADQACLHAPLDQTCSGRVARSGQAVLESCGQSWPGYAATAFSQITVQTVLCVPLSVTDRVIGTLSLARPDVHPLDADLVPLAESLATPARS